MTTTVGQLNFFKWALENKVIDYINNNLTKIDKDMNINIKRVEDIDKNKVKKSKKTQLKHTVPPIDTLNSIDLDSKINDNCSISSEELINSNEVKKRRKRRELSCSANNILNKHKFSITLEFE